MKLSLAVKISIKDLFPKTDNISYDSYNCLFINNNFNEKINLGNISIQNSIQHRVESFNSNIIYNIQLKDSNKNSLIGISQLIINFEKIKNLNINDTLTQEEKIKIIIDARTKRKIFDKIFNIGDIYLIILSEIKIVDKKIIEIENNNIIEKKEFISYNTNTNINNNANYNKLECNLTPRNNKKKEKIKSIKKDRESIKRVDTFSNYNELNLGDYLIDENLKNSTTSSLLQKNKSLQKINKLTLNKKYKKNKSNYIELLNRHKIIKKIEDIPSPRQNKTNYNFNLKKEEKKKYICPKSCRNQINKKKVTILNLMEEKMNPKLFKEKEGNYFELNNISKDFNNFKNTSINFSKIQINKINNNNGKYSSRTLNKHRSIIKSKEKKNKDLIIKNNLENNYSIKIKNKNKQNNKQIKNKNKISVNIVEKNKDKVTLSSHKGENESEKEISTKRTYTKKLYLINTERLNTDMNMKKIECKKINVNTNLNSAILQTEISNRKLSELKINLKKNKKKHILTDIDLEQLIIEKGASIKGNFHNNYSKDKKIRGAFSPKLSLKFKFNEYALLANKNDITDYKYEKDKLSRYKEKINTKLLTPKGHIKKLNSFTTKFNNDENYFMEKEEIKKKYFNLIDFYSLLSKKLKKTNKNNKEITKNNKIIKEKYNYLQKQKNNLIQKINTNESIRIKNNVVYHFEQEELFNKMINVKIKENNVYKDIFGPQYNDIDMHNKIEFLIFQKKEMMLNLIKNIVKYYGNISQIYNYDKNKKNMLKSLLIKYNIKEKVKIDLNYISNIHKENNFEDKIITEVDEDKENEEDEDEKEINNQNNFNSNSSSNNNPINNIEQQQIIYDKIPNDNNKIMEDKDIFNANNDININNKNNSYDENLNNLIKKILIEQFPENYKTNRKFNYIEKNKFSFENKIFLGYIENNDVILKEELSKNKNNNDKYTLSEFYYKYCIEEKKENIKSNFVYTKKIRQKYIKLKNKDKEHSLEKKAKNENSTTISDIEKKQQNSISRLNEIGEIKNNMSDEKETV